MNKQKRNLNNLNFKANLETVDEMNETNYGMSSVFKERSDNQSSVIKSSLTRNPNTSTEKNIFSKDGNTFSFGNKENKEILEKENREIRDNKENYNFSSEDNFTKIPKKISSTFNTINQPQFEPESSIKGTNLKTPNLNFSKMTYSNFYNTSQTSRITNTPIFNREKMADSLIISNFTANTLQKVINEFRKFGEIKDLNYLEAENKLFIQYENLMSLREAILHHNPKVDGENYLVLETISKSEMPEFSSKIENEKELAQRRKQFTADIHSNSVSFLHKILNTIFNW
jgi:hypothetical protein